MSLPPALCTALDRRASAVARDTAQRLDVQSRAFWEWAFFEFKIAFRDDVWALVPEDLKQDREFLIRAANTDEFVWDKLGAFAHDLDFFKALDKEFLQSADHEDVDPLLTTFLPCFQDREGVLVMGEWFGNYYLGNDSALPEDHWCRSDVDLARLWLQRDRPTYAFAVFTPRVREAVWQLALARRHADPHFVCNEFSALFPKHVLQSRACVLQLVEVDSTTLEHAPEFADDEEVAEKVVMYTSLGFGRLSPRLQHDRAWLLRVLRKARRDKRPSDFTRLTLQFTPYKRDVEVGAHVLCANPDHYTSDRAMHFVITGCLEAVETEEDDERVSLYTDVLALTSRWFPQYEPMFTRAIERVYHPDGRVHTRDKRAYSEAFGVA
jgi:hypothetical protein